MTPPCAAIFPRPRTINCAVDPTEPLRLLLETWPKGAIVRAGPNLNPDACSAACPTGADRACYSAKRHFSPAHVTAFTSVPDLGASANLYHFRTTAPRTRPVRAAVWLPARPRGPRGRRPAAFCWVKRRRDDRPQRVLQRVPTYCDRRAYRGSDPPRPPRSAPCLPQTPLPRVIKVPGWPVLGRARSLHHTTRWPEITCTAMEWSQHMFPSSKISLPCRCRRAARRQPTGDPATRP